MAATLEVQQKFINGILESFEASCDRVLFGPRAAGAQQGNELDRHLPILWLLMDHLLLLVQQPVYISLFVREQTDGPIVSRFTSLCENDRAFWNLPTLKEDNSSRGKLLDQKEVGNQQLSLMCLWMPVAQREEDPSNAILDWIGIRTGADKVHRAALDRGMLDALNRPGGGGIFDHAFTPDQLVAASRVRYSDDDWQEYVTAMSIALDPVLESFRSERLFGNDVTGRPRPRGFFAIARQPEQLVPSATVADLRSVEADVGRAAPYPYNARVILTRSQIREYNLEQRQSDLIQMPLGKKARAIGDTPLVSGIIDIGIPKEHGVDGARSREHYAFLDDATREAVRQAELQVYGSGAADSSVLYLPIHLGGIPWLALFTFLPLNSDDPGPVWKRYWLYREVLPTLAAQIDQAVMSVYTQALMKKAVANLHLGLVGDSLIKKTNEDWERLSHIYPYDRAQLRHAQHGDDSEFVIEGFGERLAIEFIASSTVSERPKIAYRLLAAERTKRRLKERLEAARQAIYVERSRALDGLAHSLKACMECIPWSQMAFELHSAADSHSGEHRALLSSAADSFELMLLPQGLGNLVRKVGRIANGENPGVAQEEFEDLNWWRHPDNGLAIARAYADAVKSLGIVVCRGFGGSGMKVSFGVSGGTFATEQWTNTACRPLVSTPTLQVKFPPFKRKSDESLIVAYCLLEPMVNAVKAIQETGTDLLIHISVVPGQSVEIGIGNQADSGLDHLPDGVEKTAALAAVIPFVEFERNMKGCYSPEKRTQWIRLHVKPERNRHQWPPASQTPTFT